MFDDFDRTDDSILRATETSFEFLNRSSRPEISRVRELIQYYVSQYPELEVNDLIARIRSGNKADHCSAMFELLLFSALTKLGFSLQPHPQLNNGSTARPDFLVTSPDGSQFYLEAVLASEINEVNNAGKAIKDVVMDTLRKAPHNNFMIDVMSEGYPTTQPSGKKLLSKINVWLDKLDPDKVEEEGFDIIQPFNWEHEDWELTIRPIPLKKERRGKAKSLIGMEMGGAGFIDGWTPIRDAVKFKGSRYGLLELPFLIAVNVDSFVLDRIDEMQALFGQEQYLFSVGNPDAEPRHERARNGAWFGPNGPQYTRVSGAWFFNDLNPYTIASRKSTIYLNPWAANPLPNPMLIFPFARGENGKMNWHEGRSFRDIFDLPEEWPGSNNVS